MDWAYILGSVIVMTVLGLSVGNFATSLTYRLPRGLKIANDPPYCDSCRKYLETRDMFPFFSWVINRARCRFCGEPVPALYAFVELGCALWFNVTWFAFWPDAVDAYLLSLSLGVFVITLISLHVAEKRLFAVIVVLIAGLGGVWRALFDFGIMNAVISAYLGLMAGVVVWLIRSAIARAKQPFPTYAILLAVCALCAGRGQLVPLLALSMLATLALWLVGRKSASVRGSEGIIGMCLALLWLMLFPGFGKTLPSECSKVLCEENKGCQLVTVTDCHR